MNTPKGSTIPVFFRTTAEIHQRLAYHAKRTGEAMNMIVRQATINHLELLDEKEAAYIHQKQLRKRAFVPGVVQHRNNEIPSMRKRKMMQAPTPPLSYETPVAEKLKRSFNRWAEYMENASDRIDSEHRATVVLEDIRERQSSEAEGDACYDMFKDFLQQRAAAREKPLHVVDIGNVPFIAGDVAE